MDYNVNAINAMLDEYETFIKENMKVGEYEEFFDSFWVDCSLGVLIKRLNLAEGRRGKKARRRNEEVEKLYDTCFTHFKPLGNKDRLVEFLTHYFDKKGVNLKVTINSEKTKENLKAMSDDKNFQLRVRVSEIKGYVKKNSDKEYEIFTLDKDKNYVDDKDYKYNCVPLLTSAFHILNDDFNKTNKNVLFNEHSLFIKDEKVVRANVIAKKCAFSFAVPEKSLKILNYIERIGVEYFHNAKFSKTFSVRSMDYVEQSR